MIQWDKDDLDALGLIKVDVLALGMLSAIQRALRFHRAQKTGVPEFRMQDVPPEDNTVYRDAQPRRHASALSRSRAARR